TDCPHGPKPHHAVYHQIAALRQRRHLYRLSETNLFDGRLQPLLELFGAAGPAEFRAEPQLVGGDHDQLHGATSGMTPPSDPKASGSLRASWRSRSLAGPCGSSVS